MTAWRCGHRQTASCMLRYPIVGTNDHITVHTAVLSEGRLRPQLGPWTKFRECPLWLQPIEAHELAAVSSPPRVAPRCRPAPPHHEGRPPNPPSLPASARTCPSADRPSQLRSRQRAPERFPPCRGDSPFPPSIAGTLSAGREAQQVVLISGRNTPYGPLFPLPPASAA